ncbi:MAG: hypothetical protein KGL39_07890 [Patescibacteria group bacterium]|nr:hypothetical protein [Patescibacteria group bacterium]
MSGLGYVTGLPRIGQLYKSTPRIVFRESLWEYLAQGKIIDGGNSRDPSNPSYPNVLQPGLLMGKITSSGLYGASVFGLSTAALSSTGTTLTVAAAAAVEINRRIGGSGTLTLTGPPVAAGVVRQLTATYSAVNTTSGAITITALGVNEVQTLNFANSPAGTFTLTILDLNGVEQETAPITYSSTAATLVTNIQNAINTVIGAGPLITVAGTAVTAITLTFNGTGYAALPQALVQVGSNELTAGTVSVARTTAGASGAFVSGSMVGPTDGSQNPLTLVPDGYGINVLDSDQVTQLNQPFERFPIAGVILTANVINYPSDASLKAWLKQQLSTVSGGKFVFDDQY